jgi:hypothetical protein
MRETNPPAKPASLKALRPVFACVCICVLATVPTPAGALEVSGGVSLGGVLIGPDPRLAVSPHLAMSWRLRGSATLSAYEHLNLLPAVTRLGIGVYSQTSAAVGYAWDTGNLSIGPTLSIYDMPACGAVLCGRVVGVGPGGHAQIDVYFAGSLGVSVSANLDWLGGSSLLLPGNVAAMVFAGPVFRWSPKH